MVAVTGVSQSPTLPTVVLVRLRGCAASVDNLRESIERRLVDLTGIEPVTS